MKMLLFGVFASFILLFGIYQYSRSSDLKVESPQVLAATSYNSSDDILSGINSYRITSGLEPLIFDEQVKNVTDSRTQDMVTRQYYAHVDPSGLSFEGYFPFRIDGCENLQMQIGNSLEASVSAWLNSESHRNCLLNPELRRAAYSSKLFSTISYEDNKPQETYVFSFIAIN